MPLIDGLNEFVAEHPTPAALLMIMTAFLFPDVRNWAVCDMRDRFDPDRLPVLTAGTDVYCDTEFCNAEPSLVVLTCLLPEHRLLLFVRSDTYSELHTYFRNARLLFWNSAGDLQALYSADGDQAARFDVLDVLRFFIQKIVWPVIISLIMHGRIYTCVYRFASVCSKGGSKRQPRRLPRSAWTRYWYRA